VISVRFGFASSVFTKPTAFHQPEIWLRLCRAVYLRVPLRDAFFSESVDRSDAHQAVTEVSIASLQLSSCRLNVRADGQRDSELGAGPLCTLQCHPTSVSFDDRFDKA
jgi:hypothetical protein